METWPQVTCGLYSTPPEFKDGSRCMRYNSASRELWGRHMAAETQHGCCNSADDFVVNLYCNLYHIITQSLKFPRICSPCCDFVAQLWWELQEFPRKFHGNWKLCFSKSLIRRENEYVTSEERIPTPVFGYPQCQYRSVKSYQIPWNLDDSTNIPAHRYHTCMSPYTPREARHVPARTSASFLSPDTRGRNTDLPTEDANGANGTSNFQSSLGLPFQVKPTVCRKKQRPYLPITLDTRTEYGATWWQCILGEIPWYTKISHST